jgi:hypothetical protein
MNENPVKYDEMLSFQKTESELQEMEDSISEAMHGKFISFPLMLRVFSR